MQQLHAIAKDAAGIVAAMAAAGSKLADRDTLVETIGLELCGLELPGSNGELLAETLDKVRKARNKKAVAAAAEALVGLATDIAQSPEEQEPESEPGEGPVLSLKQYTARIKTQLQKAQEHGRKAGELLRDAKGHFKKAGDWLLWAEREFNLKKAHVYRLVKIADTFGDNAAFDGVDAHALRILIDGKTDAEKMEEAERLARAGQLTPQSARQLVGDGDGAGTEPGKSAPSRGDDSAQVMEENRQLAKQCQELSGVIEELRKQLAAQSKAKPAKPAMGMLAQFKSPAMHIRLGLTEEEAKDASKARAAYRELVKYWNEESNAEAYALITEAMDSIRFPS